MPERPAAQGRQIGEIVVRRPQAPAASRGADVLMPSRELLALAWLAASTWVSDIGLIGLTGAVACRPLLVATPEAAIRERGSVPAAERPAERVLIAVAGASAAVLLLGAAARLYAQTWSVFGLDEPVTLELVRVVGVESRWGARWQPQAGLAVAAAAGVVWWARQPRGGWWMTGLAAAGSWGALPLTGHAMSGASRLPWIAQAAHGLAAGLWIGTLAAVVAVAFRLARDPRGHPCIGDLVRRFSPLAIAAVAVILVSGAATAVLYLDAVSDLWTTAYGRTLLLKVGLFAATGAAGAYNWRRLTPRLGEARGTRALLASARLELALAVGLLAVTAVLVHLAMPGLAA